MSKPLEYLDHITDVLSTVRQTQVDVIADATQLLFDTMQNGGSLFTFGASHAGILAEELYCRAGGLIIMNPVFSPTLMLNTQPFNVTSQMERLEGFGTIIIENTHLKAGDAIIIHSVSGRNAVTIDMAISARKLGAKVIVITNLTYSKIVSSRHSGGKNLYEYADIVIDNCGELGDACIAYDDSGIKSGATSTAVGAVIVNMMVTGFAELCANAGIDAPIFQSSNNVTDEDREARLFERYRNQIHYS